jgi:hypothetical protein
MEAKAIRALRIPSVQKLGLGSLVTAARAGSIFDINAGASGREEEGGASLIRDYGERNNCCVLSTYLPMAKTTTGAYRMSQ